MKHLVRFNGHEGKYFACSSPKNLEVGKVYVVASMNNLGWQKNYFLVDVEGEYNVKWFTDVEEKEKT